MRLDLFLRVRRDRLNLAIRLRLFAGAAIVSLVIGLVGFDTGRILDGIRPPPDSIAPPPVSWPPAS